MITNTKPKQQNQRDIDNISIIKLVKVASDILAPVLPLKTFIAVNPLQGLEDLPFEQAVQEAARHQFINDDKNSAREAVNR